MSSVCASYRSAIVVPVLGMHRSGTSLFTRLLNLMGLPLGSPLQGPSADNPLGFWENRVFQSVNMQVLGQLKQNQDGFAAPEALWKTAGWAENIGCSAGGKQQLETYLERSFATAHWGWKDPRTVLTFPFWRRLLGELDCRDIRPVIIVRRPWACVESLLRRGDAAGPAQAAARQPAPFLLDVWTAYQGILQKYIESALHTEYFVTLQEWLIDPDSARQELQRCASYLEMPEPDWQVVLQFIRPDLDHRRPRQAARVDSSGPNVAETGGEQPAASIYQWFQERAQQQRARWRESRQSAPASHSGCGRQLQAAAETRPSELPVAQEAAKFSA